MFGQKLIKARHYLDWAAAAPVSDAAARAYARASSAYGNPASAHAEGRAAKAVLEDARTAIARALQVKADDVIFTSGATEANNIAIQGSVKPGGHVLYLPSAHASVVEAIRAMGEQGVMAEPLPITDGQVDIRKMEEMLRPATALVCMDLVCGETGTVWNTREVRHALEAHMGVRPLLHVDASQAPFEELCERSRVGADLLVLDAAKVGGMRGLGVLVAPRTLPLAPIMHGGGQERGMRPGTPSPAHAAAFAAALTEANEGREAFVARGAERRAQFLKLIAGIPDMQVNQGRGGVAHILNLSLRGRDTDYLAALLDEAGFAVSTKSACESDSDAGSRAVLALTGDAERAKATLRISWGPTTPSGALPALAKALVRAVAFLDRSHTPA